MSNDLLVKKRYKEKIVLCEGIDPYKIVKNEFSQNYEDLPTVNYFDLCNYFVYAKSVYTQQEMMAHKSLEAYKLFENGWVKSILEIDSNVPFYCYCNYYCIDSRNKQTFCIINNRGLTLDDTGRSARTQRNRLRLRAT